MSDFEKTPGGDEFLAVGKIIRPHGVRGAVIVEAVSDWPERFAPGSRMLLETDPSRHEEVTIESATPHTGRLLACISGINNRESAERLRGCCLLVFRDMAAPLGEGEYWIHELMGMKVREEDGRDLGVVEDFRSGRAQDLLIVKDAREREFGIPYVGEFIKDVDRVASTITVRLIEGMAP